MSEKRVKNFSWLFTFCIVFVMTFNVRTTFGTHESVATIQLPEVISQPSSDYSDVSQLAFVPVQIKDDREQDEEDKVEPCPLEFSLITPSGNFRTTHVMLTNKNTQKSYWVREGDRVEEGKGMIVELLGHEHKDYELIVRYDDKEYTLKLVTTETLGN